MSTSMLVSLIVLVNVKIASSLVLILLFLQVCYTNYQQSSVFLKVCAMSKVRKCGDSLRGLPCACCSAASPKQPHDW